jgi:hypothetical protein
MHSPILVVSLLVIAGFVVAGLIGHGWPISIAIALGLVWWRIKRRPWLWKDWFWCAVFAGCAVLIAVAW